MDHIEKALEKAKRAVDEKKISKAETSQPKPSAEQTPEPEPTSDLASAAKPASSVAYSQTQTTNLNLDLLRENRLIAGLAHVPESSTFQMLRTQLLMRLRDEGWNSIAVTSPLPDTGKTMIASNLAISMSMDVNQTVLLVDMDLRRPKVASFFGITPERGIRDYLMEDIPLSGILVNPGIERLVLLPGRGTVANSSEVLSAPKAVKLVQDIKTRYDSRIAIFDLPPLLPTDDALICVSQMDTVLMVVEDGKTTEDEVLNALRLLKGSNLLGTVLNKADVDLSNYNYNY